MHSACATCTWIVMYVLRQPEGKRITGYRRCRQVHAKEKKPKKAVAASGRGGKAAAGFSDANASWLKPKAAPAKTKPAPAQASRKVAAAKAAQIAAAEQEGGYSSDSEDAPLPGELSGSEGAPSAISGSEEGSECRPHMTSRERVSLQRQMTKHWLATVRYRKRLPQSSRSTMVAAAVQAATWRSARVSACRPTAVRRTVSVTQTSTMQS